MKRFKRFNIHTTTLCRLIAGLYLYGVVVMYTLDGSYMRTTLNAFFTLPYTLP